jgi:sec-independent protein translocase protein TatA
MGILKTRNGGFEMEGLLQPTHLILILGIALLMFGPRKLPELGQGLGKGIRGFRDALRGISENWETPLSQKHPADSSVTTIGTQDSKEAEAAVR